MDLALTICHDLITSVLQVTGVPKYAAHDTVLTTTSADGKNTPITIPVPKGTDLMINIAALHYSRQSLLNLPDDRALIGVVLLAKYWDEPEVFRPDRFLGDYNRDAFLPFATGPRACIGRRLAHSLNVKY